MLTSRKTTPDLTLIITIFIILALGLIMVFSASKIWAEYSFNDSAFFLKRQLLFTFVGIVIMLVTMNINYWSWQTWSKLILLICFCLLVLVLIPGIGTVRNGSRSWIGVGAFSIQPSEFMKFAMLIFLAKYLSNKDLVLTSFKKGMLPALSLIFLAFGLIMLQPDLGTGLVMVATCLMMIFIAGAEYRHFVSLAILGLGALVALIVSAPYRIARITSFLDPWEDPLGTGFQIIQSLFAVGPGGLLGFGLGNSRQKFFYLPESHTDFIFAIIAEELGLVGGTFLVVLFAILLWRGFVIAFRAPDLYGSLLAVGIVMMIAIQVIINIGVVIGLMPVTGITLPFLSYGGSSLLLMLIAVGVLLNISRYAN